MAELMLKGLVEVADPAVGPYSKDHAWRLPRPFRSGPHLR
jgi:hypothetical protein